MATSSQAAATATATVAVAAEKTHLLPSNKKEEERPCSSAQAAAKDEELIGLTLDEVREQTNKSLPHTTSFRTSQTQTTDRTASRRKVQAAKFLSGHDQGSEDKGMVYISPGLGRGYKHPGVEILFGVLIFIAGSIIMAIGGAHTEERFTLLAAGGGVMGFGCMIIMLGVCLKLSRGSNNDMPDGDATRISHDI